MACNRNRNLEPGILVRVPAWEGERGVRTYRIRSVNYPPDGVDPDRILVWLETQSGLLVGAVWASRIEERFGRFSCE